MVGVGIFFTPSRMAQLVQSGPLLLLAWAVAGALLAALAAAVTAFETLIGFPQLEKIYGDAARNLEEAKLDWQDLDPDTVSAAELERVEDVFRGERGQWGQLVVKSAAPAPPAAPPPANG